MKGSSIALLALLLAGCGTADTQSEKIASAERETGKAFHDMTAQERADVLAKQDIFGNVQPTISQSRPISPEERREILRREKEAGY